jgi:hypothetical protein
LALSSIPTVSWKILTIPYTEAKTAIPTIDQIIVDLPFSFSSPSLNTKFKTPQANAIPIADNINV